MSTRVDESVTFLLDHLAKKLHKSKKNIVETALRSYSEKINGQNDSDIFKETCGAWKRDEPASVTIKKTRKAFHSSFTRHYS